MGYLFDPGRPVGDHLLGGELAFVGFLEDVFAGFFVVELAGGGVEGDGDLFAGSVAGELDGFEDEFEGFVVGFERGCEAAFVAYGGVVALLLEDAFEGVEDFGAPAEGVGEGLGAYGHDHELLEVDVGVRVAAAVEDVHHGGGEEAGVDAAEVAVERELERGGGGAGAGHGDGEDGVGSEFGFVLGAVDGDHGGVDEALVGGVHAGEFGGEDGLDVFYGLEDSFAEVVGLVTVAEFDGFVLSGGGSAGDCGAARVPPSRVTSASTVGLPRESRISRAWMETISVMLLLLLEVRGYCATMRCASRSFNFGRRSTGTEAPPAAAMV